MGRSSGKWIMILMGLKRCWMEGMTTELRTRDYMSFEELKAWEALAASFRERIQRDVYLEYVRKNRPYHFTGV